MWAAPGSACRGHSLPTQGWTQVCSLRADAEALAAGAGPLRARPGISGRPSALAPPPTLGGHRRSQDWARVPETEEHVPASAAQWQVRDPGPEQLCREAEARGAAGSDSASHTVCVCGCLRWAPTLRLVTCCDLQNTPAHSCLHLQSQKAVLLQQNRDGRLAGSGPRGGAFEPQAGRRDY